MLRCTVNIEAARQSVDLILSERSGQNDTQFFISSLRVSLGLPANSVSTRVRTTKHAFPTLVCAFSHQSQLPWGFLAPIIIFYRCCLPSLGYKLHFEYINTLNGRRLVFKYKCTTQFAVKPLCVKCPDVPRISENRYKLGPL
jgi:hypothetical protein